MTDVISPGYHGPERRKRIVFEECSCHLKHERLIDTNVLDIKQLEEEMRNKVNWKLFALALLIIVGSSGFLWREINATNRNISAVDKRLERVSVKQQAFESNAENSLTEIKESLKMINENLYEHIKAWKEYNGMNKEKGK